MKKTILLTIIFSLLLLTTAYATIQTTPPQNYTILGADNSYYVGDTIIGTGATTPTQTGVLGIGTQMGYPLVADFDGDGVNEIVVWDDTQLRYAEHTTLMPIDSLTQATFSGRVYQIAYDIDGDGKQEVIASSNNADKIVIYDFNETDIAVKTTLTLTGVHDETGFGGDIILRCRDVEDCITIYTRDTRDTGSTPTLTAEHFNSTNISNKNQFDTTADLFCHPTVPVIELMNLGDSKDSYIYSVLDKYSASQSKPHLYGLDVDPTTKAITVNFQTLSPNEITGGINGIGCDNFALDNAVSSPLVAEIDGEGSTPYILVAREVEGVEHTQFYLDIYQNDGTYFDRKPDVFDVEGEIVGNPFIADVYPDTGRTEVCTAGFDSTEGDYGEFAIHCHSNLEASALFNDDTTFIYELTESDTALTGEFGNYNILVHSSDITQNRGIYSTVNMLPDEFITPYGIMQVDSLAGLVPVDQEMDKLVGMPLITPVVVPVDAQKVGLNDFLLLDSTRLMYYDDGFSNTPGTLGNIEINPCLGESIIKVNSSVTVTFSVNDVNDDVVQGRVVLYENEPNEQDTGWINASAGVEFLLGGLVANQTTANSDITIYGRDVENPTSIDSFTQRFSVGLQGVTYGQCVTTITLEDDSTNATGLGGVNLQNNAITNSVNEVFGFTGIGTTMIWLIVMIVVGAVIWINTGQHGSHTFAMIGMVEGFLLILGTILGFMPLYIIVTISIMLVAGITLFVWGGVTGRNNN